MPLMTAAVLTFDKFVANLLTPQQRNEIKQDVFFLLIDQRFTLKTMRALEIMISALDVESISYLYDSVNWTLSAKPIADYQHQIALRMSKLLLLNPNAPEQISRIDISDSVNQPLMISENPDSEIITKFQEITLENNDVENSVDDIKEEVLLIFYANPPYYIDLFLHEQNIFIPSALIQALPGIFHRDPNLFSNMVIDKLMVIFLDEKSSEKNRKAILKTLKKLSLIQGFGISGQQVVQLIEKFSDDRYEGKKEIVEIFRAFFKIGVIEISFNEMAERMTIMLLLSRGSVYPIQVLSEIIEHQPEAIENRARELIVHIHNGNESIRKEMVKLLFKLVNLQPNGRNTHDVLRSLLFKFQDNSKDVQEAIGRGMIAYSQTPGLIIPVLFIEDILSILQGFTPVSNTSKAYIFEILTHLVDRNMFPQKLCKTMLEVILREFENYPHYNVQVMAVKLLSSLTVQHPEIIPYLIQFFELNLTSGDSVQKIIPILGLFLPKDGELYKALLEVTLNVSRSFEALLEAPNASPPASMTP